jgi:hypothetical protein
MSRKQFALRHRNALLDRVLDQHDLVHRVQRLEGPVLARLIRSIGLEDAGELVALASAQQLERIFDEDLWVSDQPGVDESFDAARFGLWLSVLVESGAAFAAQKLLELDEDFLIMGLAAQVLVLDMDELAVGLSSRERDDDDEQLEKQLEGTLYMELEQYRVIAKHAHHWDALSAILLELSEQHYADFSRIVARCCDMSSVYVEEHGGLYEVLSEAETLADDVAGAREHRREQLGFVAPSSALAFLRLAAQLSEAEVMQATEPDAITRAHFRATPARASAKLRAASSPHDPDTALLAHLASIENDEQKESERLLPGGAREQASRAVADALRALQSSSPALYDERALELAYLANVLLSGHTIDARRMRPVEAFEAALAFAELGRARLVARGEGQGAARGRGVQSRRLGPEPAAILQQVGLVKLFQLGYGSWARGECDELARAHPLLGRMRVVPAASNRRP